MMKGGKGISGAGKVKIPDVPYKPNPLEIAGAVRKLSGDVNAPLPLILLDTAQSLMTDKSVIVTPVTRERVEGIQRIVETVDIFPHSIQAGSHIYFGAPFFRHTIAMDWTSGVPIIDMNNNIPAQIFDNYDKASIYGFYVSCSEGERMHFEIRDTFDVIVIPPTIFGGTELEDHARSFVISLGVMPLVTLDKTNNPRLKFYHDGNGADNFLTLWGKLHE